MKQDFFAFASIISYILWRWILISISNYLRRMWTKCIVNICVIAVMRRSAHTF